jgi:glycosyltransferase involved in cell wall biosynthesis
MITYNQETYISRAIESALLQKGDFDLEIVIGDDGSSDQTRFICENYQRLHPEVIKYEYNNVNIGMQRNVLKTYYRCNGQYVALLEGDDEWTDQEKLAKQLQVLQSNSEASICYSNSFINDTRNSEAVAYFNEKNKPQKYLDKYELINHCVVPTCTVLFRNKIIDIPEWFTDAKASAYFLYYLLAKKGGMIYYDEKLALYNHHYGGMSRKTKINEMLYFDSLLNYKLVPYFDSDEKILDVVIDKNVRAINDLFHRRSFNLAIKLFWKLPLISIIRKPQRLGMMIKLFIKIHLLFFMSKDEQKGTY